LAACISPATFDSLIPQSPADLGDPISLPLAVCKQNNRGTIASLQKAGRIAEKKRKAALAISEVERDGREEDEEENLDKVTKRVVAAVRGRGRGGRGRVSKSRGGRARAPAIAAPSAITITGGRACGPGIVTPAARTSGRPRKRTARALGMERELLEGMDIE
jgi:hypothetical protein